MQDYEILAALFKQQDPIFIDLLFNKHFDMLINLGNYIKEKNLSTIPYEKQDLQHLIIKSIYQMHLIEPDNIKNYGYLKLLRRIFVQQLINVHRKYSANKEKVLSVAYPGLIVDYKYQDNFLTASYSRKYDVNKLYSVIIRKMHRNIDRQIFNLYLNNVKPQQIAKLVNKPIKKVYNTIFLIKNHYQKSIQY